jgi:hypothetical protein
MWQTYRHCCGLGDHMSQRVSKCWKEKEIVLSVVDDGPLKRAGKKMAGRGLRMY